MSVARQTGTLRSVIERRPYIREYKAIFEDLGHLLAAERAQEAAQDRRRTRSSSRLDRKTFETLFILLDLECVRRLQACAQARARGCESLLRRKRFPVAPSESCAVQAVEVDDALGGRGGVRCRSTALEHPQQLHRSVKALRARLPLLHDRAVANLIRQRPAWHGQLGRAVADFYDSNCFPLAHRHGSRTGHTIFANYQRTDHGGGAATTVAAARRCK